MKIPGRIDLCIVGASARAAATSARRAGWTVWCADLFADADLQQLCTVCKIDPADYPCGLLSALESAASAPVMYTGGLENRPELVARMRAPLWGNNPEVLRAVRNPARWSHCLQAHGFPCPAISLEAPSHGRWLLKPRKSAGGLGIQVYKGQSFQSRTHFLQEAIEGTPCSAVFLGQSDDAILLGTTQQLVAIPWLNSKGFHYAGSIGPLPMHPATEAAWRGMGSALAREFHLRGLFGVDAILHDGIPWPVEINPRYTASVEILERAYRLPFLLAHGAAFEPRADPGAFMRKSPASLWGKAILYARGTLRFPARGPWLASLDRDADLDKVEFADIPNPGEVIEQGKPVLTHYASASSIEECTQVLQEKALTLDRRLWG